MRFVGSNRRAYVAGQSCMEAPQKETSMPEEYSSELFVTDWQISEGESNEDSFVAYGTRDEFVDGPDSLGLNRDEKVRQYLAEVLGHTKRMTH